MTYLRHFFIALFSLALAMAIYLYFYLGWYKSPTFHGVAQQDFHLLYKVHHGPYHKIGSVLNEVESWARANGVSCPKTFGEFLDNPQTTAEDRLRSHVGCVLAEGEIVKTDSSIQQKEIKGQTFLRVSFDGSPSIGPMKVYPRVQEWFEKNQIPMPQTTIEVYLPKDNSIITEYYFPVISEK